MRRNWWKIVCVFLLTGICTIGFIGQVPAKPILNETIRNLYFHVPMWFCMMIFFITSVVYAIKYLRNPKETYNLRSVEFANTGILFGMLGLITGMIWANYTWGAPWSNDPKQIGAAIALLIYLAYLVLRNSIENSEHKARIGAVYNIFAFALLFPTIWIIPRMVESLHPGGQGNPAFSAKDADVHMRMIFWLLAVPAWTLLGLWITNLRIRLFNVQKA